MALFVINTPLNKSPLQSEWEWSEFVRLHIIYIVLFARANPLDSHCCVGGSLPDVKTTSGYNQIFSSGEINLSLIPETGVENCQKWDYWDFDDFGD